MKKSKKPILVPKRERLVCAQSYLQEINTHQDNIKEVEFAPPKLGSRGFGSFRVRYDTPVLLPKGVRIEQNATKI